MRRRLTAIPSPLLAGLLVFLMAFGIYGASTQQLTGYEPETGAITQGLVLHGVFWDVEEQVTPSLIADIPGKGGHHYARTGLLQPLLEAPFYAAGHFVDKAFGWEEPHPYRLVFLWFYNPFVAALAAVAMFALVYLTRRSLGWAVAITALFVFASIAWPYAKIGMETTFMFAILTAFALGAWARLKQTVIPWALTGFAAGASAATKPYAVVTLLGLAVLLWPTFVGLARRQQVRLGVAAIAPVILWGIAIAVYNYARFGSITDFGYHESSLTLSMPLNTLGLLFSPGKGLIFYSPLVVLGALGLPRMWRSDRAFTASLLVLFITLTCVTGASEYWGDEVWGPRYIVPVAWALLIPIAWWVDSVRRRKVLAGVTVVAVLVQVVAVSAQYARYDWIVQRLTGVPIYRDREGVSTQRIPYGDDPTRWIPELSALLLQTESLISSQIVSKLGGEGLKVTYRPFEGPEHTVNLSDPSLYPELDYWWNGPFRTLGSGAAALLMLAMSGAAGLGLYRMGRGEPVFPSRRLREA